MAQAVEMLSWRPYLGKAKNFDSLEDAVVASSAGCGDVVVGTHEAHIHGQKGTAGVGYAEGYAEGTHLAVGLQHHTCLLGL